MRVLKLQTRHPSGHVEQLVVEAERVLIGSGAHCEVRLPVDQASVEHVLVELGPAGIFARALSFDPPPTVNQVPFTQIPLAQGAVLGIQGTQIQIELAEGAQGGDVKQQKRKSSPLTVISFLLILPASGYLFLSGDESDASGVERPPAPELWGPAANVCQYTGPQAQGFARERMAIADAKRERRPFHVQDGVAAVPLYETASACFRAGGDPTAGRLADESAKYLRREMSDDFRARRVRLEHFLDTEDYASAQKEVRVLLQFVEGKAGDTYVTWLSQLDRKLKLKLGESAAEK